MSYPNSDFFPRAYQNYPESFDDLRRSGQTIINISLPGPPDFATPYNIFSNYYRIRSETPTNTDRWYTQVWGGGRPIPHAMLDPPAPWEPPHPILLILEPVRLTGRTVEVVDTMDRNQLRRWEEVSTSNNPRPPNQYALGIGEDADILSPWVEGGTVLQYNNPRRLSLPTRENLGYPRYPRWMLGDAPPLPAGPPPNAANLITHPPRTRYYLEISFAPPPGVVAPTQPQPGLAGFWDETDRIMRAAAAGGAAAPPSAAGGAEGGGDEALPPPIVSCRLFAATHIPPPVRSSNWNQEALDRRAKEKALFLGNWSVECNAVQVVEYPTAAAAARHPARIARGALGLLRHRRNLPPGVVDHLASFFPQERGRTKSHMGYPEFTQTRRRWHRRGVEEEDPQRIQQGRRAALRTSELLAPRPPLTRSHSVTTREEREDNPAAAAAAPPRREREAQPTRSSTVGGKRRKTRKTRKKKRKTKRKKRKRRRRRTRR